MSQAAAIAVPHALDRGDGPPVLFLHGIGGGADAFRPQLERLSARWRVLAWDMPGYGRSPPLAEVTWPALAEAVEALLDAKGLDRVHLVGHSMGGMVALEFAASRPGRLRSLTLSGTSSAFGKPDGEWQRKFIADRLAPIEAGTPMRDLAKEMVAAMTAPGADPAGLSLAEDCMADVPPETYKAALRCLVTFDRRDALPGLAVPTLVLAGEHDPNAPSAMMERMAAKIAGARFELLEGAGHLANLERPAEFDAALESFLRSVED